RKSTTQLIIHKQLTPEATGPRGEWSGSRRENGRIQDRWGRVTVALASFPRWARGIRRRGLTSIESQLTWFQLKGRASQGPQAGVRCPIPMVPIRDDIGECWR